MNTTSFRLRALLTFFKLWLLMRICLDCILKDKLYIITNKVKTQRHSTLCFILKRHGNYNWKILNFQTVLLELSFCIDLTAFIMWSNTICLDILYLFNISDHTFTVLLNAIKLLNQLKYFSMEYLRTLYAKIRSYGWERCECLFWGQTISTF